MAPGRPLEKLLTMLRRYVVMTDDQYLAVALWIVHTHIVRYVEVTPYLSITSPEKRCGKSTLLDLLEQLSARPFKCILPSEAVVYREVHHHVPTLLLDEVDAIFNPKSAPHHEGLRAILNSGFRAGVTVPRASGPNLSIEKFSTYCPKAIAAIGVLPDTITDRAIPIRLQRRKRTEPVERFRIRAVTAAATPIREALQAWGEEHGPAVGVARPVLPDELSDRGQDAAEPLLAIADMLGYGNEARTALVNLLTAERADEREVAQVQLLRDVKEIFDTREDLRALATEQLLMSLKANGNGWADWYGRGIEARDIAVLLKPYEVHPRKVRVGETVSQGYRRDDFHSAWDRYAADAVDAEDDDA